MTIGLGIFASTSDPQPACDACYLDNKNLETRNIKPCPCLAKSCSLHWCRDHKGPRHMAYRLHQVGLVTDQDIQQPQLPQRLINLLAEEQKTIRATTDMAMATVSLNGKRLCTSPEQWAQTWSRCRAPEWAYAEAPKPPQKDPRK